MAVTVVIDMKNGEQIREEKADLAAGRVYARECVETGIECNDDTRYQPAANIKEINIEE